MTILKIPERTFRRYTSIIYKQDREVWLSITRNELSSDLLRLRSSLADTYRYCMDKLKDSSIPSSELLDWLEAKNNARIDLVQILTDYPREVDRAIPNEIEEEPQPEQIIEETRELKQSRKNIQKMLKVKQKK